MSLFARLADLPLAVESECRERRERDTSSGFRRTTTVVSLDGDGETGRGEDVTYETEDHDRLASRPSLTDALAGTYTLSSFSDRLDEVDLFDAERPSARHYRRWAYESAALDLALRQGDTHLAAALGRERSPVRFVASTRLSDDESGQPTAARLHDLLDRRPDLEFKLDPTSAWTDDLVAEVAATGSVRVVDLKGQYDGTTVDQPPDPDLYERVVGGFPDAVVEDPAVTPATRPVVERVADRLAWDAPVTGTESLDAVPVAPAWLNVKPSRFGTLESLLDTVAVARQRDIGLYGGGQFELDVGRGQIQALASVLYPDGPNDVAPGVYNDPGVGASLPPSPLDPSPDPVGFAFP